MFLSSFIAHGRRSAVGAFCVGVLGCSIGDGTLRDEGSDKVQDPGMDSSELCARNQRVEDRACIPCPDGRENPAGDDPTGDDTECSEAPLDLGAPCTTDEACESQHCADGVCCESACDGPCMACSDAGACNVTPTDDAACGNVSCPVGALECLLYTPAITSQRCRGFGECKTVEDCPVGHQPRGTQCTLGDSPYSVCVNGNCAHPSVLCGPGTCAIGSGSGDPRVCCNYEDRQACTSICADTHLTAPDPETSIYCDEHEDCRPGHRCALLVAAGGSRIFCTDDPDYDGTFLDHHEVCDSPAMDPIACTNGAPCDYVEPLFDGWVFCRHST